jgi:hypothetical protein
MNSRHARANQICVHAYRSTHDGWDKGEDGDGEVSSEEGDHQRLSRAYHNVRPDFFRPPPGAPFLLLAIAAARGTPVDSSNQGRPTNPATSPRLPPPRAPPSSQTPLATLLCQTAPSCSTPAVDACRMVSHPIRSLATPTQPRTSHAQNSPSSSPTHLTCTCAELVVAGFAIAACRRRRPCCMPPGHGTMPL